MNRVLVAMPTADKKDYCVDEFIEQIKTFTYPLYDIFEPQLRDFLLKNSIVPIGFQ